MVGKKGLALAANKHNTGGEGQFNQATRYKHENRERHFQLSSVHENSLYLALELPVPLPIFLQPVWRLASHHSSTDWHFGGAGSPWSPHQRRPRTPWPVLGALRRCGASAFKGPVILVCLRDVRSPVIFIFVAVAQGNHGPGLSESKPAASWLVPINAQSTHCHRPLRASPTRRPVQSPVPGPCQSNSILPPLVAAILVFPARPRSPSTPFAFCSPRLHSLASLFPVPLPSLLSLLSPFPPPPPTTTIVTRE